MKRLLAHFIAAAACVAAVGCASGTCADQLLLQPHATSSGAFIATPVPEPDGLWLDSPRLSLYLEPCIRDDGRLLAGTLCGTLIIPEGETLQFVSAYATLTDGEAQSKVDVKLHGSGFKPTEPMEGSAYRRSSSLLASRLYSMPGTREYFKILTAPPNGPSELVLPHLRANSTLLSLPTIRLEPAVGKRCYHGAW